MSEQSKPHPSTDEDEALERARVKFARMFPSALAAVETREPEEIDAASRTGLERPWVYRLYLLATMPFVLFLLLGFAAIAVAAWELSWFLGIALGCSVVSIMYGMLERLSAVDRTSADRACVTNGVGGARLAAATAVQAG